MTTDELRRTASYQALQKCLLRHLQARREVVLSRAEAGRTELTPEVTS